MGHLVFLLRNVMLSAAVTALLAGGAPGAGEAAGPGEAAQAAKAAETLKAMFGDELRRARITPSVKDDLALARRLLAAADEAAGHKALAVLLLRNAAELASGYPTGYRTALKAIDRLGTLAPDRLAEWTGMAVEIRRKQFDMARFDQRREAGETLLDTLLTLMAEKKRSGDLGEAAAVYRRALRVARSIDSPRTSRVEAGAAALRQRMKLRARIRDLQALLRAKPENTAAREGLVRLYVVDMDDPATAAKYVEGVADPELKKYVPAAAKGVEAAPELACLELAEWYQGLAKTADPPAKPGMFARAKAYYERFLRLHDAEDLQRVRAALGLKKVEAELAEISKAGAAMPGESSAPGEPDPSDGSGAGSE